MGDTYCCPSCNGVHVEIFYELGDVPVHSVTLLSDHDQALDYPTGEIALGFCRSCGFIFNTAFDPNLQDYSAEYESTQSYSPTFNKFHYELAERLVNDYDLRGKDIIEIGCGQGEFLTLLCELGDNRGVGFDPAYDVDRYGAHRDTRVTYIKDYYSENYKHLEADFVCCKMTLEHIHDTANFIGTVRRSLMHKPGTTVFFQVPDVSRMLDESAFWDIYYEHCSYFSPGSLARLFRSCGFQLRNLTREYEDQYLIIEAEAVADLESTLFPLENDLMEISQLVTRFSKQCQKYIGQWGRKFEQMKALGKRVVIWGAGSKGVAFLNTIKISNAVEYAVDINPNKHGTFMAVTGQEIVAPEFLKQYCPDLVLIMNPIYLDEIRAKLEFIDVQAEVITV